MKRNFNDAAVLRAIEEGYGVSVRTLKIEEFNIFPNRFLQFSAEL